MPAVNLLCKNLRLEMVLALLHAEGCTNENEGSCKENKLREIVEVRYHVATLHKTVPPLNKLNDQLVFADTICLKPQ